MMEWIRKHDILTRLLSLTAAIMLWLYVVEQAHFYCLVRSVKQMFLLPVR